MQVRTFEFLQIIEDTRQKIRSSRATARDIGMLINQTVAVCQTSTELLDSQEESMLSEQIRKAGL